MSTIIELADAMVNELNGGTFSQPLTAIRYYLPRFELPEMATLHVSVVPKGIVVEPATRSQGQYDYQLDLAVQQRYSAEPADLDSLMALSEELADYLRFRRLGDYPTARWLRTKHEVIYHPEHLEQLRQFTSLLTVTYRLLR